MSSNPVTHDEAEKMLAIKNEEQKTAVATVVASLLIQALESNDRKKVARATDAFVKMGPLAARGWIRHIDETRLMGAAANENIIQENVADEAAHALARLGPRAIPELIPALDLEPFPNNALALSFLNNNERYPMMLASIVPKAVTEMGSPAVPALIKVLLDDRVTHDVHMGVVGILRRIGPAAQEALPSLVKVLRDADGRDADAIASAIAAMGSRGISLLARALKPQYGAEVRASAANALGEMAKALPDVSSDKAESAAFATAMKALAQYRKEEEATRLRARKEEEATRLRARDVDADSLLRSMADCMAAEGKMQISQQLLQYQAARTLSVSQSGIDSAMNAANEGAEKCQNFGNSLSYYMNTYGDEGYAYLWSYCDRKYNTPVCDGVSLWLANHR